MTTMPRPIYETKEEKDIDLAHLFATFVNNRGLILGITGFFAALGIAYALLATPVYMATAMIQIEPKNGLPSLTDVVSSNPPVSPAQTEIALLKSRSVVGQAVDNLNLDIIIKPHHFPIIGGFMARRFEPSEEGELGWYPAGFDTYAWGGEVLEITDLIVPETLYGEELTLEAAEGNAFILRRKDRKARRVRPRLHRAVVGVVRPLHPLQDGTGLAVQQGRVLTTARGGGTPASHIHQPDISQDAHRVLAVSRGRNLMNNANLSVLFADSWQSRTAVRGSGS